MLIRLWVEGYISLHFSAGMYQTYVVSKVVPFLDLFERDVLIGAGSVQYVSASARATRITRFSADEVDQSGLPFELTMQLHASNKVIKKGIKLTETGPAKRKAKADENHAPKRVQLEVQTIDDDDDDVPQFVFEDGDGDEDDAEALYERFRAGEVGNSSSKWNSDGEGAIQLDSD